MTASIYLRHAKSHVTSVVNLTRPCSKHCTEPQNVSSVYYLRQSSEFLILDVRFIQMLIRGNEEIRESKIRPKAVLINAILLVTSIQQFEVGKNG